MKTVKNHFVFVGMVDGRKPKIITLTANNPDGGHTIRIVLTAAEALAMVADVLRLLTLDRSEK